MSRTWKVDHRASSPAHDRAKDKSLTAKSKDAPKRQARRRKLIPAPGPSAALQWAVMRSAKAEPSASSRLSENRADFSPSAKAMNKNLTVRMAIAIPQIHSQAVDLIRTDVVNPSVTDHLEP